MSILIDKNIKVICQGFIGSQGIFYLEQVIVYGIKMVGGVILGKGGIIYFGLSVFNIVCEVVVVIGVIVFVIYVLVLFCKDFILEVIDVGIKLIIIIIEGISTLDMLIVKVKLDEVGVCMIGLNCLGVIILGECKIGIQLGYIYKSGKVGIVFCFGILIYEVVKQIMDYGFGQSICVGIGGDSIFGFNFIDIFEMFEKDLQIEVIVMIGEIGGSVEEEAVVYIKEYVIKLVVGYIVGVIVLKGKCMGYVGVIIVGGKGIVDEKFVVLEVVGVKIVCSLVDIGEVLKIVLK